MRSSRSARVVTRLATFNVPGLLRPWLPAWLTHIAVSLACFGMTVLARLAVDHWVVSGSGTYSIGFPAIVIAVLFAGWPSGVLTTALITAYAWFVTLPSLNYYGLPIEGQWLRTMVNAACLLIVTLFAEIFRRAAAIGIAQRDQQIADRDLFLSDFDHRTKNSFASVVALLELQRKRAGDEAAALALGEAKARVESMARAHLHLYRGGGSVSSVDAHDYLNGLCEALGAGLYLPEGVSLHCAADPVALDRDRAIGIGLIANELVTNAAKHAFVGRESGRIDISLIHRGHGLRLSVADDGVGSDNFKREGGLGTRLIDAFVRQLGGKLQRDSDAKGSRFVIDMPL